MHSSLGIATIAVLTAVVAVFTLVVRIPTPGKGYLNLGDVAICFVAFTFNPFVAFLAGGIGTAVADIISSYPQWAPISFCVHGLEGLCVALLVRKGGMIRQVFGIISAVLIVAGGYFACSGIFMTTFEAAATEIPGNIGQAAVGGVLGLLLSKAVIKAYPPVKQLL
jgi:uncharacterized membrane protein